ncbi:MAG: hypothetical protein ACT4PE_03440, partial [Candidatus Eiseniibacteriota bacterium]
MTLGSPTLRRSAAGGCAVLLATCLLLVDRSTAEGLEVAAPEVSGGGALAGLGVQGPATAGPAISGPSEL